MFDAESDESGDPPIFVVRVTDDGYEAVGEGWLEQAENLEKKARLLADEKGTLAWRHVGESYTLITPSQPRRDVH